VLLSTDPVTTAASAEPPGSEEGSVKFEPEMKKNGTIAASTSAPVGMDEFNHAQYGWEYGLLWRSHSSPRPATKMLFNDAAPGGLAFRFDAALQKCRYRGTWS